MLRQNQEGFQKSVCVGWWLVCLGLNFNPTTTAINIPEKAASVSIGKGSCDWVGCCEAEDDGLGDVSTGD
jgi:hypothetical protein